LEKKQKKDKKKKIKKGAVCKRESKKKKFFLKKHGKIQKNPPPPPPPPPHPPVFKIRISRTRSYSGFWPKCKSFDGRKLTGNTVCKSPNKVKDIDAWQISNSEVLRNKYLNNKYFNNKYPFLAQKIFPDFYLQAHSILSFLLAENRTLLGTYDGRDLILESIIFAAVGGPD